ncbi:MAG TPA: hypothetical protein VGS23_06235, partial [Thermoplasmata archaeon]|nr:hypothetical protein [Thermoplasmata archaeon]
MTSNTFQIRIPRTHGVPAETNPLEEATAPPAAEQPEGDLPGTFITAMPPLPDADSKELEVTAVNPPYSYARVSYNDRTKEYLYEVIEPQLSKHERDLLTHLKETLTRIIGGEVATMSAPEKRVYLRREVENYLKTRGMQLSPLSTERLVYYITRDFVGFGPVDVLIADPQIEDISCDG